MVRRIVQSYDEGEIRTVDLPPPAIKDGQILVETRASLVSVGTERHMVELARKSILGKALERPDLVKKVVNKARTEGVQEAYRQAKGRLEEDVPLGYSSAGVVTEVGAGVDSISVGDRVACAGSGYAGHAEVIRVPEHLCVRLPSEISFEEGAFVALGGIALEALRLSEAQIGETVVVIGLGLLGQLTVQLLDGAGCRVYGVDLDAEKVEMAEEYGARAATTDYDELEGLVEESTGGRDADSVIIMASTPSNEPLEKAADLARERGKVVATGLVGLDVPRERFYEKELELAVSRAWGPGLYDEDYTERGIDYPYAYARWTAGRNMAAFLDQVKQGTVRLDHLVSHRFPFEEAEDAYDLILDGAESTIGVILEYASMDREPEPKVDLGPSKVSRVQSEGTGISLIGAGQFARGTLLPVLQEKKGMDFRGVATTSGTSGRDIGERYGFDFATTEVDDILDDDATDAVFILTRHGSHAELTIRALRAGKHVFVEKPLAVTPVQLQEVVKTWREAQDAEGGPLLMVGFNRRFSPFARWIRSKFEGLGEPLTVQMTVNAGKPELDSWIYDPKDGGGRIVGELCHFIDLASYLSSARPERLTASSLEAARYHHTDNVTLILEMDDGSLATITYVASGDKAHPRERVEVYGGGRVGVIENFKKAYVVNDGRTRSKRNWLSVDRGHSNEVDAFLEAIQGGGSPPVPFESYVSTTRSTFAAERSVETGEPVELEEVLR